MTAAQSEDPETFDTAYQVERAAIHAARERFADQSSVPPHHLVGLALSGGGIRSATFCLGVLQALAARNRLTAFDYLSTVSGGGYIGSWLSAWINRADGGLEEVQNELKPRPADRTRAPEATPITWLRKYSNYLAPKLGLLSTDSLTLIATWTRNVILNLIIFVALLAVLVLVARVLITPAMLAMQHFGDEIGYGAAWVGFFLFPFAISVNLSRIVDQDAEGRIHWLTTTTGVFSTVIAPAMLAAVLGSLSLFAKNSMVSAHVGGLALGTAVLLLLVGTLTGIATIRRHGFSVSRLQDGLAFPLAYAVALIAAFLMLQGAMEALTDKGVNEFEKTAIVLTFGPPAILVVFGVCGSIVVGLVGRAYYERSREWWGRMNAWLFVMTLAWLTWFGLAFYALPVFSWIDANCNGWFKAVGGFTWLSSLAASLLVPKPSANKTLLQRLGSRALDIAASIVVVGFLIIVAALTSYTLRVVAKVERTAPTSVMALTDFNVSIRKDGQATSASLALNEKSTPSLPAFASAGFRDQEKVRQYSLAARVCAPKDAGGWMCTHLPARIDLAVPALVIGVLIFLVFGFRVDVNKFSLHNMYKNRLVRCYLGASVTKRAAQPFTGFDDRDDLSLLRLRAEQKTQLVQRPLHIVNAAMNITQGDNLAWQERKAANFTFSPWHCGFSLGPTTGEKPAETMPLTGLAGEMSDPIGIVTQAYRDSRRYASRKDETKRFSLGSAMATSGAAVSPNMGKNSSAPLAFVMTLFNVRLGRWSPNPAQHYWRRSSPWFGLRLLLAELFGLSNERSDYVYLSDGGHFDNTAIYELVRRECRTILAVDAGADFRRSFQDMANLVRKCRVDFGVEVNIGLDKLGTERAQEANSKGYVIGTIDYGPLKDANGQEIEGKRKLGTLIVIKPTLIGLKELGVDVFSYSRDEESFPQQSTADQFFNESQFESYRALGYCIASNCLEDEDIEAIIRHAAEISSGARA